MTLPKKVLLYESLRLGHRETIIGYVTSILSQAGVPFVLIRDPCDPRNELAELNEIALREHCTLVHVLSADGGGPRWIKELALHPGWRPSVPFVGTYYLYSNLYKLVSGLGWDFLHARCFAKLLISDDYLSGRVIPPWRRRYLSYLPDPWAPEEFRKVSRSDAEALLQLPSGKKRFLLFGDLSARKGLDLIIRAAAAVPSEANFELLLVGKLEPSLRQTAEYRLLQELVESGRATLCDQYVPEDTVSTYFYACDFVLCCYPRWFKVSSGTFTRACAAGKPVIAAAHGVIGHLVKELKLGMVFETGSVNSLRRVFEEAYSPSCNLESFFDQNAAGQLADDRSIDHYARVLLIEYQCSQKQLAEC